MSRHSIRRARPKEDATMAEVRALGDDNHGFVATRDFKEGDVILVESTPLVRLALGSQDDEAALFAECDVTGHGKPSDAMGASSELGGHKSDKDDSSFYERIAVPSEVDHRLVGKFRGMVQAAVSFACQAPREGATTPLLSLYHPSLTSPSREETDLVQLSQQALSYVKARAKGPKLNQQLQCDGGDTLLKVMLIWSCNSFQGGRIYRNMSRVNHSCDPNAIIKTSTIEDESQSLLAASPIKAGEEVTISYLGTFLYASRSTRRDILLREKYFQCHCQRCSRDDDLAMRIPCTFCHPRKKQLEEDVQYDDDCTTKYMMLAKDCSFSCEECKKTLDGRSGDGEKMLATIRSIETKVESFIRDDTPRGCNSDAVRDGELIQEETRRQLLELTSSFLGARHWATNILLLLELTHLFEHYHADLLSTSGESASGQEMETLAEGIDMLERIVRFVDGLKLKLHRGHLLSDVIIGIARALVSLGDIKSQKYAREWLTKLDDYAEKFEGDGLHKVVEALKVAWARGDADKPASKKLKAADSAP